MRFKAQTELLGWRYKPGEMWQIKERSKTNWWLTSGFEGRGNNDSRAAHCGNLRKHAPQHCLILSVFHLLNTF